MWLWATAGGSHTLAAPSNLGLLGFKTQAVIELACWAGLNVASGGREQEQGSTKGSKSCPPCQETVNPLAGTRQGHRR